MSILTPLQIYLLCLMGRCSEDDMFYMTREEAYESLKTETIQDFTYDVDAWKKWLIDNRKEEIIGILNIFDIDGD